MSVKIGDVSRWVVDQGIGHVVVQFGDPGVYTACRQLLWCAYDGVQEARPKRICRKCRAALETMQLMSEQASRE